jgi:hypothetical protein
MSDYRKTEKYREMKWRAGIRRFHGWTAERFEQVLATQGGCCAICRTDQPGGKKRWYIDHDHKTDEVRGLLCHRCNSMLGFSLDNPETLVQGAEYLRKERKCSMQR